MKKLSIVPISFYIMGYITTHIKIKIKRSAMRALCSKKCDLTLKLRQFHASSIINYLYTARISIK